MLSTGMAKRRADTLLVQRGLAPSPEQARALILAGQVFTEDQRVEKPGTWLSAESPLRVAQGPRYVGKGGLKLEHALFAFHLEVRDAVALDIGASTGGFTHCLLEHGARRVYALDVGYGQLDYRLRHDSRVVVMERVNARYPYPLSEGVDLVTADVSFISLLKVVPPAAQHLRGRGHVVALVKPQFEARQHQVGKGGVVRDPAVHAAALGKVCLWAIDQGFRIRGITPSPLEGDAGNREFFVLLEKRKQDCAQA